MASQLEERLSCVPSEALDRPCSDEHLRKLALKVTGWKEVALFLNLDDGEIEEVEAAVKAEEVRARNLNMLRKWRKKFGKNATYRCLANTLWDLDRADLVDLLTNLLQVPSASSVPQASSSTQPQHGPTPDQKSALQLYIPIIKRRYRSKMPGCTVQFPRPPTHKYFDLSLIEREDVKEGSTGKELVELTMEGKVKEVLEKRTPVELKDLFKLDQDDRKVILIEGPPGSGKTSLSWHICQEWGAGRLFSEFDLIVYVQLRDPAIQAAQSIADLLPRRDNEMAQSVFSELKAKGGEGVLFILDGWDELPGDLPPYSPIQNLIKSDVVCPLEQSAVIVASRPEASTKLHDLATSRVQIVGFTPEKAKAYFTECLKGDSQATKVFEDTLKENPVVESSCYIPLNAAIIVTLFIALGHQLPPTLTGVFVSLITYCILRHCKGRTDIDIRSLSSLDNLPPALQPSFDSLCALAFQGTLVNQITFSEKECMIYPEFATLSLLRAVEGFLDMGLTRTYNFLHLSIQELLAARHMSKLPADSQIEIVQCLLDDNHERFPGVFRFYAGITSLRTPGIEGIIQKMAQMEMIVPLMQLLLECLHEVQDPALYQVVAEEWSGRHFILRLPSPVACLSAGYLLPKLSQPYITLMFLDDQRVIQFTRGLGNGCVDQQQLRSGLSISLQSLILHGHGGLEGIVQLLSSCTVSELNMSFNQESSIDPLVVLKCIVEAMASVRSLTLEGLSFLHSYSPSGESPGPALCDMLQLNKTLKTLVFAYCPIGPYVASIAKGLGHNTTLKKLQLRRCGVTDTGLRSLAEMLTTNTILETLDIRANQVTASGVSCVAEALTTNSTLRVLILDDSTVCSNPEPLAVALTVNTTLETLWLEEDGDFDRHYGISGDVTVELMANGVLQHLLTIAIERTVSEYGGEETGRALVDIMEEWKDSDSDSDWVPLADALRMVRVQVKTEDDEVGLD